MATLNNTLATFSIGVCINDNGRPEQFATGRLNAASAEQVAAQLVALAHAVRDEARHVILNGGE